MSTHSYYDTVLTRLKTLMSEALPQSAGENELEIPFLEMGANSLMLMDVQKTIESEYGISITITQFFEELTTINALVQYIDEQLQARHNGGPAAQVTGTPAPESPDIPQSPADPSLQALSDEFSTLQPPAFPPAGKILKGDAGELEAIFASQIRMTSQAMNDLIKRQLEFLSQAGLTDASAFAAKGSQPDASGAGKDGIESKTGGGLEGSASRTASPAVGESVRASSSPGSSAETTRSSSSPKPKGALHPQKMLTPMEIRARGLTPAQQTHLETLIRAYNERTPKSKAHTERYRGVLADSRASIGFRFSTKEMLYPLVSNRAFGSRVWDVDGNEYIDITMGQGVSLFGHHPEFIEKALSDAGPESVELGPRPYNAGELAELLCEMTGFDRVTFTNTGTEAVMAALRLARAATGRTKIVMFEGAYHGHADSVMGMPVERDGRLFSQPVSPGTPQGAVDDLWILPYDEESSLDFVREHGDEIAAVFVEPVQSRNPRIQPRKFLHALRKLTADSGALLVFDEMITGFRCHPGGAQAWFDVKADMATYGKVIGGGMPIGVVAGKAHLMDPIDGGSWQYGDTSYPKVNRVVFGGTFCQHPLAMTTSLAALRYLKEQGPSLQETLNERTRKLANELNDWFDSEDVPIEVVRFGSLFRFEFSTNLELLFYHMNLRGVFVWEWRNCFLSTAHTDEDVKQIIRVVKESVIAMREGGFIPPKGDAPESGNNGRQDARVGAYPLNTAQRQLATLAQISPQGSMAYHVSPLMSITGELDTEALSQAIDKVTARHDALRTVIRGVDRQEVRPAQPGLLQITDLGGEKDPAAASLAWLDKHSRTPMDLENGPLFTAHLLRLGPEEFRLVLKGHHIVVDGLSMNLIVQEIAECYNAAVGNRPSVQPVPMQYRDYLEWQESNSFEQQERYWLGRLPDEIPVLELPADKPEPAVKSWSGGRVIRAIDSGLFNAVKKFSVANGATHFMTFFSIYTLWLHRLSGQEELVIGMPVAGRSMKGADHLVGYCTHLIPIHSKPDWTESFKDYVIRMRGTLLQGYQHQDYPFARLMEKRHADRKGRYGSLVQAVFNLDRPGEIPPFTGLEVSWQSQAISHTAFDIAMNLTEIGGELTLECDYNSDRFHTASIDRFLDCFINLVREVTVNPDRTLASQPLMNRETQAKWLVEWNRTEHPIGPEQLVHRLFEAKVRENPKKMVLTWEGGKRTWNTLNKDANRLARYLKQQGAGSGAITAIYLNRSPHLVTAILAVLKSGGSYLPLDPDYPSERLSFMMDDAKPEVLITESALAGSLSLPDDMRVLLMDAKEQVYASFDSEDLSDSPGLDDPAYILYTSGSTGRPKGTVVPHRGMANYLTWAVDYYRTAEGSGSPLHMSIGFDATITSFFTPLLSGRTLHIVPAGGVEIENIVECMTGGGKKSRDWSLVKLTPSHLELLNGMIPDDKKAGLTRCIVLGGEALLGKTIASWRRHAPSTRIINEYGPTETVVGCAVYDEVRDDLPNGPVPIGRPIWNTRLYVLDRNGYPVPPGVDGELYIGGEGLAAGYLNRPELTAERFIDINDTGLPDAVGDLPPGRLYRTGDRVRLQDDGNLVFLGRYDQQIKLRGYRIEPAEIEQALLAYPGIREAIVKLQANDHHRYLVAYLVTDKGETPDRAALRAALREQIPGYMIPSHFIGMETIPLTGNGKTDVKALPVIPVAGQEKNSVSSPRSDEERRVAAIWSRLLDLEEVGVNENFFDIGGHSMLVLPMREELSNNFGREVTPADIFTYTTVSAMAKFLSQENRDGGANDALVTSGRKKRSIGKRKKPKRRS